MKPLEAKYILFISAVFSLLCFPIAGQPNSGSSRDDNEEKFNISAGVGMIASPRAYIGTKAKVLAIPAISARYKRFYFQGIRGGFEFLQAGKFTGSGYLQARFRGLEPEDSDFLLGMQTRKKSADVGLDLTKTVLW